MTASGPSYPGPGHRQGTHMTPLSTPQDPARAAAWASRGITLDPVSPEAGPPDSRASTVSLSAELAVLLWASVTASSSPKDPPPQSPAVASVTGPLWRLTAPMDILLVEDNPGDARLAAEAFKEGGSQTRLHVVQDGIEAMSFLRREGRYQSVPRPDLVLLDLNLPRKDGREVLAEIKQDSDLKRVPVIVLTTSQAESDIVRGYELHANCYIVKPVDFDRFIAVVKGIETFWRNLVRLPPH